MTSETMTRSEQASGMDPRVHPVILLDCEQCGQPLGWDTFAGVPLPWLRCLGSTIWDAPHEDWACDPDRVIDPPPAWLLREAGAACLPGFDAVPLKAVPS